MEVERASLAEQLAILMPAVAAASPVTQFMHIWFDGEKATAFNDVIGIEVPCELGLKGGLMGASLLGLLKHSAAKNAVFEDHETEVLLKLAGAKATLPILSADMAISPFPSELDGGFWVNEHFKAALAHVLKSVTNEGFYGNAGVTIMAEGKKLAFYTTDGKSISWARIALPKGCAVGRVSLCPVFCDRLLKEADDETNLYINSENAVAVAKSGLRLFGRVLEAVERDFAGTINKMVGAEASPLPAVLERCFDRALVLSLGEARVEAKVDKGLLRLFMKTDLGELNEVVKLEKPLPEEGSAVLDATLVRRGMDGARTFLFTPGAFVLLGEDDRGYIAASPAGKG